MDSLKNKKVAIILTKRIKKNKKKPAKMEKKQCCEQAKMLQKIF